MSLEPLATKLEKACDSFLNGSQDGMPRVVRRSMQPILDVLAELVQATKDEVPIQTIFQYPVLDGKRAPEGVGEADAMGVLGYKIDTQELVWRVMPSVLTPAGVAFLLVMDKDGNTFRTVSIEDVIELGIKPAEIVSFVKRLAGAVAMDQLSSTFNQKPASA